MKAMIFAAGLGTRLKPLTNHLPKALVPISGKPLLEYVILRLKQYGFDEIIVNVHHFPDQIIAFLKQNNNYGIRIEISDERDQLLDTGGAIAKVARFFDDGKPFLVHNVDIFSNVDLHALVDAHIRTEALCTLVVSKRDTFRYLLFEESMRLVGWVNEQTGKTKPLGIEQVNQYRKLAFGGIQVLSPRIFELMEKLPPKFPIIDFYLSIVQSQFIAGYEPIDVEILDVGKLNVLDKAEHFANLF